VRDLKAFERGEGSHPERHPGKKELFKGAKRGKIEEEFNEKEKKSIASRKKGSTTKGASQPQRGELRRNKETVQNGKREKSMLEDRNPIRPVLNISKRQTVEGTEREGCCRISTSRASPRRAAWETEGGVLRESEAAPRNFRERFQKIRK